MFIVDQFNNFIFYYFALPHYGRLIGQIFRSCLQTLLYKSAFQGELTLDCGQKVDLDSAEGSSLFYWAVVNRGPACLPGLSLDHLDIEMRKKRIAQHLLYKLLSSSHFEPTLADGTPILHLLLRVGPHYVRPDQSVDLFELYISRHFDQVDLRCPWTGYSTLELLEKQKLEYKRSNSYQIQIVLAQSGQRPASRSFFICVNFLYFLENIFFICPGRLPPVHLKSQREIGWREAELGKRRLDLALASWRQDEDQFCCQVAKSVVSSSQRGLVDDVMVWLRSNLEGNKDARYGLEISGSISENSKIYPLDEIDVLLQVWLDVDVVVNNFGEGDMKKVQQELEKPVGKQPVQHLMKLFLRKAYPYIGEVGDELTAETFGKVMDVFIADRLQNAQLPSWLRLSGVKGSIHEPVLLERTKAGLILNLEYLDHAGKWQELSIDLVPTLVLDPEQREIYLQVEKIFFFNAGSPLLKCVCSIWALPK